jgi:fructuronate reductase
VGEPAAIPASVGIVHLGWGAFHRTHQAVYTEDAMAASGELHWGILGAVHRSARAVETLRAQGGRYTVLSVGSDAEGRRTETARVVASVVDVASPLTETSRLLAAIAEPSTHVVTLTVTESGYARRPDGRLDVEQVADDLEALAIEETAGAEKAEVAPATSVIGLLVRGLAARRRCGGAVISILSCDNVSENGAVLKRVVDEFVDLALTGARGEELRGWLASSTTWPSSMVDRITPAVVPATLDRVATLLGVRDEAAVAAEPFSQWVIQDDFIGPRPKWELAGAEFAEDVVPWENTKLRMLNGTHSLLAYAGRVLGYKTVAEALSAPEIAGHARTYIFEDAMESLVVPSGADLRSYGESVLRRFANTATGYSTLQVSTDGTRKIPIRWGGVLAHHLADGRVPQGVAFGLAAWSEFVRRAVRDGVGLSDPAGDVSLRAAVHRAGADNPEGVARELIPLGAHFDGGDDAAPALIRAVVVHVESLTALGDSLI